MEQSLSHDMRTSSQTKWIIRAKRGIVRYPVMQPISEMSAGSLTALYLQEIHIQRGFLLPLRQEFV
jgi:hypothetical protein